MRTIAYLLIWFITNSIVAQTIITSEDILILNDNIKLPGILTYDAKLKKQPLLIFVHGSGNVDRNGNQLLVNINGNYIKQLADSLNQRGIAFYRFDKRTATKENLKYLKTDMRLEYFVDDVKLAINSFKEDIRFSSIILIGHSQGSLVAMLASEKHIDKYVSIAGIGEGMDTFIINSYKQVSEAMSNTAKKHIEELKNTGEIEFVDPSLIHLFSKPNQPFILSWMKYNPSEEIKKIKIPILILNGTKDLQVFTEQAEKLHKANPKSELVLIENMNHVLKHIDKDEDNVKSYFSPDYPLSVELINSIDLFIKQ